ncbi:hypothetical protein L249_4404 [Ophiocordyceps polyrhachis-furcata BCC 54312]|uniref:Uncharacterized protein n=1 Tax=Ophiocordyceps polyrhachis-furcata BCC 54312 TaxID=1330021 RepID=A0A367L7E3_9HYPO|nr:hypothetical protein L249_4404 [Ophiocordyceps polyrhachis-furcata BCC 54312]
MPLAPVVVAPGVVIAVSVTMAVALALYGSPELRRYADDARRRIAMAVHSFGDNIDPDDNRHNRRNGEPRFNRPEDADGFMLSSRDAEFDADDETLRIQREELLYWNNIRLRNSAQLDNSTAFQRSCADVNPDASGLRHRADHRPSVYVDPFADEVAASDIYSATTLEPPQQEDFHTPATPSSPPTLVDAPAFPESRTVNDADNSPSAEHRQEAYASIQAWAQQSSQHDRLYASARDPALSDDSLSDGQLTPTATEASAPSLIGSAEHISQPDEEPARPFDVLSQSDGFDTPASWSDLGSVVSDNDLPVAPAHW